MKAKSIKGASPNEIEDELQQCMAGGFRPTLAVVFISIKQDWAALVRLFEEKNIDVLGATSCGEFIDGYQGEGSIVILLLDLQKDFYTILFEEIDDKLIADVATQIANKALQKFKKPAFIICSTGVSLKSEYFDGEALVRGIENVIGHDANMAGGMAGDDGAFSGSFVFTNNRYSDEAIVALILDEEKVLVNGMAVSGWKPLGITRTATETKDGWLYGIDGQPALDLYLKYLGMSTKEVESNQYIFEEIGFHYPFLAIDAGDPEIRTPLKIDKDNSAIKLDFPIPEGKQLQFAILPDFDIVENVLTNARELKHDQHDAEALLIFSCAGRHSALGPLINSENEGLQQIWNAPMAGFFTYGEYGKGVNGKQRFHSTTCSWVALKEK